MAGLLRVPPAAREDCHILACPGWWPNLCNCDTNHINPDTSIQCNPKCIIIVTQYSSLYTTLSGESAWSLPSSALTSSQLCCCNLTVRFCQSMVTMAWTCKRLIVCLAGAVGSKVWGSSGGVAATAAAADASASVGSQGRLAPARPRLCRLRNR